MTAFFVFDNIYYKINTYYYMNKKLIRLTEQDLHRIVKESVEIIMVEEGFKDFALAGMLGLSSLNANADAPPSKNYTYEVTSNLLKNSRAGEGNSDIETFLNNIREYINFSSRVSTKNIKFFGRDELKLQNKYMDKIGANKTNKYKMFWTEDGTVLMPINYTVKDVKNELFTLNLGNFVDY